jgi:phenylacetyl-CoA:acceptor oxidoreductase subunit 2
VLAQAAPPYPVALALLLVAAGLAAVWHETGRRLRALNVFLNPFTSWMTRESYAAVAFFALGASALAAPRPALLAAAGAAALVFLWCQARILHAAKGIPAWRAPQVVALIVFTGLAEGAGLLLLFSAANAALGLFALAVVARALAWSRYRAAVRSEMLEPAGKALLQIGTVAALLLAVAAVLVAEVAPLAGAAALVTGWRLKFVLVTRAAFNQGYALPHLPVRGAR